MAESNLASLSLEEKRELARKLLAEKRHASANTAPLSAGQEALWFVHLLSPDSPAYNFVFAARSAAPIDVARLQKCCQALVARHSALRTTFELQAGKPVQIVHESMPVEIGDSDAGDWSDDELLSKVRVEADRGFALDRGPLIRIHRFRRASGEHVLALVVHHIIADLWSMDILVNELAQLYAAAGDAKAAGFTPVGGHYQDFVDRERKLVASPKGEALWEYWQKQLSGSLPTLELPMSRRRPPKQTYHGDAHRWKLPADLVDRLRQLAIAEKTTLFTTLLAAFHALLVRYTGQADSIIGTTSANRNSAELDQVVGYFLNQLVVRVKVDPQESFSTLLAKTRDEMLGALAHEEYPYSRIVERIAPPRDPSRTPIFQAMFIWDKPRELGDVDSPNAVQGAASQSFKLQPMLMEQRGAPFDLALVVYEVAGALSPFLRYNTDLFEHAAMERMAGHFTTLLEAISTNPQQPICQIDILTESERAERIDWNAASASLVPPHEQPTLLETFREHVEQRPTAIAVTQGTRRWTYADLDARADALAARLRKLGVRAGRLVAVALPRSPEAVASLLAIWKVGAAYLPLDPAYPRDRLQYMLDDSRAAVLITLAALRDKLPDRQIEVVELSTDDNQRAAQANGAAAKANASTFSQPADDDLGYAIYTSGSTGRPKGVAIRYGSTRYLVQLQRVHFGLKPTDHVLQFASLSFDASLFEIVLSISAGATLAMADQDCGLPGPQLAEHLRKSAVTFAAMPPSVWAALPDVELPDLHTIVSAGEACAAEVVNRWAPGRRFFNGYGPTETTVGATVGQCLPGPEIPSIGRPITGNQVYLLDAHLMPVPVGVPGEICVAGPGIALGYLNEPALTAERFVPNPFWSEQGAVMYRTGDLASFLPDGRMSYQGRIDHQVKVRGFRIELDEIAAVLEQHEQVRQAVVTAAASGAGLIAYLVLKPSAAIKIDEVRAMLRTRLPEFMQPSAFVTLEAMPLTTNGKIDRAALPQPEMSRPEMSTEYVAPRNEVEEGLCKIVATVLQLDRVGVHDNFFDLGGASMQTLRVVDLAKSAGITLAPELLFQYQTIAELAEHVGVPEAAWPSEAPAAKSAVAAPMAPAPVEAQTPVAAPPTSPAGRNGAAKPAQVAVRPMVIESLGMYLPENAVPTADVLRNCRKPIVFPLERMTGIKTRRVVGEGEFAIDLARQALDECLRRSQLKVDEIDLLLCCNISRLDAENEFWYEPSTAVRLKHEFGLSAALPLDLSNACAGMFTGLEIARSLLASGAIRSALVVSGEHITHLTTTAQRELEGFMDPRLACLTLGDAGVALAVKAGDGQAGFRELDMFTLGAHSRLCIGKISDHDRGAIMVTEPVKSTAIALQECIRHASATLTKHRWKADRVDHVILHQTSQMTLEGALKELNSTLNAEQNLRDDQLIINLAERGNTATTTHFVALADKIKAGRIRSNDNVVFGISGSGQVIGTALYTLDDLPDRMRTDLPARRAPAKPVSNPLHVNLERRVRIESVGLCGEVAAPADNFAMLNDAAGICFNGSQFVPNDIDLVIHAGIYRNEYLSEPAMAALVAGDLAINHQAEIPNQRKTLAFDLMNGAVGFLSSCYVAGQMIRSQKYQTALVVASEIENNHRNRPDRLIGLAETASAVILASGDSAKGVATSPSGFGAMYFASFPEKQASYETHTWLEDDGVTLAIDRASDLAAIYLKSIETAVADFLTAEKLSISQFAWVVPPQISPAFVAEVAKRLGVPAPRTVDACVAQGDLFTSSVPHAMARLRQPGGAKAGDQALLITVGSGIQVGCAIYHF